MNITIDDSIVKRLIMITMTEQSLEHFLRHGSHMPYDRFNEHLNAQLFALAQSNAEQYIAHDIVQSVYTYMCELIESDYLFYVENTITEQAITYKMMSDECKQTVKRVLSNNNMRLSSIRPII